MRADITSLGQNERYDQFVKANPNAAGGTCRLEDFARLGVRDISVINPPWKPGSASRTLVFLTMPVDSQWTIPLALPASTSIVYTRRMKNFEKRRDRYELFSSFENPLVNINFLLDVPDFRPWCKARQIPVFHFFLYCVLNTVKESDNFMYRIHEGEVIRIDDFPASYTVINGDDNLNYTRFAMTDRLDLFIERSLKAKRIAEASSQLINTGAGESARAQRNNIFITSLPWLDMTSIEHPVLRHADADIPCISWGKFGPGVNGRMAVPFSVQAHHGFVDGYHIGQLAQALARRIASIIA